MQLLHSSMLPSPLSFVVLVAGRNVPVPTGELMSPRQCDTFDTLWVSSFAAFTSCSANRELAPSLIRWNTFYDSYAHKVWIHRSVLAPTCVIGWIHSYINIDKH
jgi:hypothetical protein